MTRTPLITVSVPRTGASPNMCLIANATDDPAGSRAYRPAGGACRAVMGVDMAGRARARPGRGAAGRVAARANIFLSPGVT